MQITKLIKNTTLGLALTSIFFTNGILAIATIPSLDTPAFDIPTTSTTTSTDTSVVTIPLESTAFGINMTSCFYTFDWEAYIENLNNNRTSAPYIEKGCIRQENVAINGEPQVRFYRDFEGGSSQARTALGNTPVLGLFENEGFTAQGIVNREIQQINSGFENVDRTPLSALTTIFSQDELRELFPTTTGEFTTGLPRLISTGRDEIITVDGEEVYAGGFCKIEGGRISVRTEHNGQRLSNAFFTQNEIDRNDPTTACALSGEDRVVDQNLEVYQFLYEIPYPNAEQCLAWFDVDEETCKTHYRTTLGRDLAGNTNLEEGDKIISVYNFYSIFGINPEGRDSGTIFPFSGWKTPTVGNREGAENGFIASYNGFKVFEF